MAAMNVTMEEAEFPNHMVRRTSGGRCRPTIPFRQLFARYRDAGLASALVVPALAMNIAGLPGIAANLLLILVTWRKNTLRGSTNYLLALTAFCEILHQSAHLLFLFITATGINFIPYSIALPFQLHSIFGVTAAQTVMASTAADRLLSVMMPWSYEHINGFWYLFGHTLVAIGCGAWMAWNAIVFAGKHPQLPVTGFISDLLVLDMEVIFKFIMLLCALNILLYALVWAIVHCRRIGNTNQQQHQIDRNSRLFKSLLVIVLIVIGGYMLNNLCRLVINHMFSLDDIQMWSVNVFGGILLNIGASAETPTLYAFSTDYRKAINQELGRLFCRHKIHAKTTVVPISAIHGCPHSWMGTIKISQQRTTTKRGSELGDAHGWRREAPRRATFH